MEESVGQRLLARQAVESPVMLSKVSSSIDHADLGIENRVEGFLRDLVDILQNRGE